MYHGVKTSNMGDFGGLGDRESCHRQVLDPPKLSKPETAVREARWDWGALDQSQS